MLKTVQARLAEPVDRIRASIDPESIDAENRTFVVVWSTGARAPMYANIEGEGWIEFDEELSLDPARWDFTRVENGTCPLLDSHAGYYSMDGLDGQIGRVLSVTRTKREARALCQFSFERKWDGNGNKLTWKPAAKKAGASGNPRSVRAGVIAPKRLTASTAKTTRGQHDDSRRRRGALGAQGARDRATD